MRGQGEGQEASTEPELVVGEWRVVRVLIFSDQVVGGVARRERAANSKDSDGRGFEEWREGWEGIGRPPG